jgi:hypothetical protein
MSKMMLKMIADMAGVSPDEIMQNVEQFRTTALEGVQLLQSIDARLAAIENHLGIERIEINDAPLALPAFEERQ